MPPASAPSQRALYPSISVPPVISPVQPEPRTKSSAAAAAALSVELHRILLESLDYSTSAQPPVSAPPQEAPYPINQIPPAEPEPPTNSLVKILVPTLLVPVCAVVGLLLWLWHKRRRDPQTNNGGNSSSDEQHEEAEFETEVAGPRRFHYRELATATGNFTDENRLGAGGFGSVYKGTLPGDNKQVAVKRFSPETSSQQGRKEFESEVKIIGRLRTVTWCSSSAGATAPKGSSSSTSSCQRAAWTDASTTAPGC